MGPGKKPKTIMTTEKDNIAVEITCQSQDFNADLHKFESLTRHICKRFSVASATVSIAIVGDETTKQVNAEFLDKTSETDVISFDLTDDGSDKRTFELVVNFDEAARQSQKREHSRIAELALYITHGMLHNLGFDDAQPAQAQKMHNTEDEILQETGFGIIYNT